VFNYELLQRVRVSDDSDIIYAIETQMAAMNDDSHMTEFDELALVDTSSDDHHMLEFIEPVVEVKLEDLQDVKEESADEYDAMYFPYSVKVCF